MKEENYQSSLKKYIYDTYSRNWNCNLKKKKNLLIKKTIELDSFADKFYQTFKKNNPTNSSTTQKRGKLVSTHSMRPTLHSKTKDITKKENYYWYASWTKTQEPFPKF